MTGGLAVAVLILTSAALFFLPLVPAIRELYFSSDSQPLTVVQQHAGEIRYFAESFRNYIATLRESLDKATHTGSVIRGVLPDGVPYLVMGSDDCGLLERSSDGICQSLIAVGVDLVAPEKTSFLQDIYAAKNFVGGEHAAYRAILGEKNIELGAASTVGRWIHAVGTFVAQKNCDLHGRISSNHAIRLDRGCAFQRLNAPQIALGRVSSGCLIPAVATNQVTEIVSRRFLYEGDYEIAAGELMVGNLCVRGDLRVGSGARVLGSVKSGARLTVEPGAVIEGSLVSMLELHIGRGCVVHGPIIAERRLVIASEARCGDLARPTTVTAARIEVAEGTVVFGSLWARELGVVVAG